MAGLLAGADIVVDVAIGTSSIGWGFFSVVVVIVDDLIADDTTDVAVLVFDCTVDTGIGIGVGVGSTLDCTVSSGEMIARRLRFATVLTSDPCADATRADLSSSFDGARIAVSLIGVSIVVNVCALSTGTDDVVVGPAILSAPPLAASSNCLKLATR